METSYYRVAGVSCFDYRASSAGLLEASLEVEGRIEGVSHTTILNWLPSNARPPRWKRDTRATWIACTCATPANVPTDLRYRRLAGTPRFQTTRKAPSQQIWQLSWQQEVKLAATTLAGRSKAARGEQTRQQWCGGSAGTVEPRESSHVRAAVFLEEYWLGLNIQHRLVDYDTV